MPLSYAQQRLWFLYQMEGAGATYNIPLALRLEGELNQAALEQALGDVMGRHEALRTVFPQEEGVPYQKVVTGEEARPRLTVETIKEAELSERLAEAVGTGMELERELPLRLWLFRIGENRHVLLLVLHHIAGDGWSLEPLARDLEEAYRARVEDKPPEWEPLPVQYGDYTLWQRELLGEGDGCRKCDQPAAGVLEESAGGNAGRAAAAHRSNATCGDELSGRNGAAGTGCGTASRIAGAGAAKWSEFVHGAAGGSGGIVVAAGSRRGHTHWDGSGGDGVKRSWKSWWGSL